MKGYSLRGKHTKVIHMVMYVKQVCDLNKYYIYSVSGVKFQGKITETKASLMTCDLMLS